jgi:predicted acetyltransferase
VAARTFRPANPDDLDRLVEIHMASYADPRGAEARRRNFLHNPLGAFHSDLWVCVEEAHIVGHAFLFSLRAYFGGEALPIGGIASLAVAPEARKTGVATALMEHLHGVSLGRGDVLTMLYAFRQGFYSRCGYAPVTPAQRLIFAPSSVPREWRDPSIGLAMNRRRVEDLWQHAARACTGALERPTALWDHKWLDERRVTLMTDEGYIAWELIQSEAHAEARLHVHELVATSDAARRALVGVLGAQEDHVSEIELAVPLDDPLVLALMDPDRRRFGTLEVEHCTGMVVGGPMIRLCSIERALEARTVDASFAIEGTFYEEGGPLVTTDRKTLGALLFGGWKLSEAIRLGLAESDAPERVLAHPRWFSPDPF